MAKKRFFDEDIAYSQILEISDNASKYLEGLRDEEVKQNPSKKDEIFAVYRNKLQSVYRIKNNAFALMLRGGLDCFSVYIDNDNEKVPALRCEINDKTYTVDAMSVKNILAKDYESVISEVLNDELSEVDKEIILNPKQAKQAKQETPKPEKIESTEKPKKNDNKKIEKISDEDLTEAMLGLMDNIVQEKPVYEAPKKEVEISSEIANFLPKEEETPVVDTTDAIDDFDDFEIVNVNDGLKEASAEEIAVSEPVKKEAPAKPEVETVETKEPEAVVTESNKVEEKEEERTVPEMPVPSPISYEEEDFVIETDVNKENFEEETKVSENNADIIEDEKPQSVPEPKNNKNIIKTQSFSADDFVFENDNDEEDFVIVSSDDEEFKIEESDYQLVEDKPADEPVKESVEEEQEQIIKIKKTDSKKARMCPYCHSSVGENDSICPECGYDLENTKVTESDLKDADNEDEFNRSDIERILREIKEDYERNKALEEAERERERKELEAKEEQKIDLTQAPQHYAKDNLKAVKLYSPEESDTDKRKVELICDVWEIKATDPPTDENGGVDLPVRDIRACVFPLSVPENGNERIAPCAVYIEEDDKFGCFCSSYGPRTTNTIIAKTDYHNFLFRWDWLEGKPKSTFLPSTEINNIVETKQIQVFPSDVSVVGYGHPFVKMSEEYLDSGESAYVHALVIPDKDADANNNIKYIYDSNKNIKCVFILELKEGSTVVERTILQPRSDNYEAIFAFENKLFKIACKSDDDDMIELKLEPQQK